MLYNINKTPILRALAMPKHLSPSGTIFGGWLVSKMDLAGGIFAWNITNGKIRTVRFNNINFMKPVFVADLVSYYAKTIETNNSSIKIQVDAWVYRTKTNETINVMDGLFTYVAIDEDGKTREIKRH